ncbi:GntR family transcriptional regulator [Rhodococcoides yunnanense]|uniref:GntR family transcriptional regulator n=1 Tax=Rhodococcoides yunnanense TaxID=278209 RepID=UPI00093450A0|nr:GntR family transcriptional regulator [Rhodococcus yunnanensis]
MQQPVVVQPPRHPRAVGGSAGTRQRSTRIVHQLLRSSIKSGVLKDGENLNEEHLITSLDSTRSSVRTALQMLADEGLVKRQRKMGTIVQGKPVQLRMHDIIATGSTPIEYVRFNEHIIPSAGLIRERMQTDVEHVRMLEFVMSVDSTPIGTLTAFQINPNAPTPMHMVEAARISELFVQEYGVPFGRMDCWVDAVPADDRTARMLKVEPNSILLVRDQVLYDTEGYVHEFGYAHYRADMVSFHSSPDMQ